MNKIETKILNCSAVREAEKNMVFAARLTQRGHMIHSMDDLVKLYEKSFLDETVKTLGQLPHPATRNLLSLLSLWSAPAGDFSHRSPGIRMK